MLPFLVIVDVRERRIHDGVGGDVETVGHARYEDDEKVEHQGEVDEHEAPGEEVALLLHPLDVQLTLLRAQVCASNAALPALILFNCMYPLESTLDDGLPGLRYGLLGPQQIPAAKQK